MPSFGARLKSATGTYRPSIWQNEFPNCSFAMSLRPGNCTQPDRVDMPRIFNVAPQRGQLCCVASTGAAHHSHFDAACADAGGTTTGAGAGATTCAGGGASSGAARLAELPHATQKLADSGT